MKQRGRKSSAALETPVLIHADSQPISATEPLTVEQADIFAEIISSLPGKFFEQAQSPLVCAMARHIVSARRLSKHLDKMENLNGEGVDMREYLGALDARRKESAQIVAISRALRLTNQSRYRPGRAGRDAEQGRPAGVKPPWEY